MCSAYILYSIKADRFYYGHTCDDLESRLRKHNTKHNGFTGKYNDWAVVYTESFENKKQAIHREMEWKTERQIKNRRC
ncbi:MAG: GIY-YIG nuclease family protein [Bacteroidetes bacterium]|nr:GIY-YIG nuclease family protein [Bacteroidota bacterium]